ncbi:unnamed protein product [Caenorhabditis angaria]|uniref:Methyltransferase FkbM domain-containing protein n=1 Tax=Caenorhabditis angaria TaxID=860376 RepID=A0A9P1MVD2_9PELO|nr:unnamed protein product [Caenorhabditis angaria]
MKCSIFHISLFFTLFLIYFLLFKTFIFQKIEQKSRFGILQNWLDCAQKSFNFNEKPQDFWNSTTKKIDFCGKVFETLEIRGFNNTDEQKFAILPKNRLNPIDSPDVLLSLGIGKDIKAEKKLKLAYGPNPIQFYGADPMFMDNYEIYREIGSYFPLAISSTDGFFDAGVLVGKVYRNLRVYHINFLHFIKNILNLKIIDHLWMDNEYSEYGLFPYFYKNGILDQEGITVCQLNMEVHNATLAQKSEFKGFVRRIIDDQKYAIVNNYFEGIHYRLFLVNLDSDYCLYKFFYQL